MLRAHRQSPVAADLLAADLEINSVNRIDDAHQGQRGEKLTCRQSLQRHEASDGGKHPHNLAQRRHRCFGRGAEVEEDASSTSDLVIDVVETVAARGRPSLYDTGTIDGYAVPGVLCVAPTCVVCMCPYPWPPWL